MLFPLGVKELCSKGVKTLAFSSIPLPSGRLGGGFGEAGRGLLGGGCPVVGQFADIHKMKIKVCLTRFYFAFLSICTIFARKIMRRSRILQQAFMRLVIFSFKVNILFNGTGRCF